MNDFYDMVYRAGQAKVQIRSDGRPRDFMVVEAIVRKQHEAGLKGSGVAQEDALQAAPSKQRRRKLTITNTVEGFRRLTGMLSEFGLPVMVGFEATGYHHRALMHHLWDAGLVLKLVSSVALARTRAPFHNSGDNNNPKHAQVILHMLKIGAIQVLHDPTVAGTNDIQEQSKTHEVVSKAKTEFCTAS